jgi:hypothetical protein
VNLLSVVFPSTSALAAGPLYCNAVVAFQPNRSGNVNAPQAMSMLRLRFLNATSMLGYVAPMGVSLACTM